MVSGAYSFKNIPIRIKKPKLITIIKIPLKTKVILKR
jgi:hypothetical protein